MKDLLRIADLAPADLELLLDLSDDVRSDPRLLPDVLRGDTVVTCFAEPSTSARLPFASAIVRLGGVPEALGSSELQLGGTEAIDDTAEVISRYARAVVISTPDDEAVRRLAAAATIPVVNARTDQHDPCQALADLLTIRQRVGSLRGRRLAYLGDGTNVAHSLMEAGALAGMDVVVATPPGYEPNSGIVGTAERLATTAGGIVWTTHDPLLAVAGADAVCTDAWLPTGSSDDERAARATAFAPYQVNGALMAEAAPGAVFLHRLPAHRGEEVAASVIDGPQSAVFDEAESSMHTAQALLIALLSGRLGGRVDSPTGTGALTSTGAPAG